MSEELRGSSIPEKGITFDRITMLGVITGSLRFVSEYFQDIRRIHQTKTLDRQRKTVDRALQPITIPLIDLVIRVLPTTRSPEEFTYLFEYTINKILREKDYKRLFLAIASTRQEPSLFVSDITSSNQLSQRLTGTILTCIHFFCGDDSFIAEVQRSHNVQEWLMNFISTLYFLGKNQFINEVPIGISLLATYLQKYLLRSCREALVIDS